MKAGVTIVGLGEALWDLLPEGKQLGGAPLNVAHHAQSLLQGRGIGVVASRVGNDPLGEEVIAACARRQVTTDYIQRDREHPTGTVRVSLVNGEPSYEFAPDVAWDHFEFTEAWKALAARADGICYGTLAQRSAASRSVIRDFLSSASSSVRLFDVNLRQTYYDHDALEQGCCAATHVKLSEHELPALAKLLRLPPGAPIYQLSQLRARYNLQAAVYTRGRRGTMLVLENKILAPPPVSFPSAPDADAIGAGDACAAGFLVAWILGMSPLRAAELANNLGAFVASRRGATPDLPPEILQLANN